MAPRQIANLPLQSALAPQPAEPRGKQSALRELSGFRRHGEQPQKVVEPLGGAVLEIEQKHPPASHDAAATGKLAERLLADLVPEIPHELQAFLEEAERVHLSHRFFQRGPNPPVGSPSCCFRFSIADRYSE
jgi:hypothetical protein